MAVIISLLAVTAFARALAATGGGNPANIPVMGPISLWRLPQDGSPMYYRYFRDRISWYEADAVCQFHHGNLVTVDSSTQYDALRSFLRHENILSNVWIGLVRSHKDGDFTWAGTYRSLSGDGYWAETLPVTSAPLCATSDPARDYRWHARHCGGAEVAAFVCELRVPDWTKECTISSVNGIQYAYLPEDVSVQLEAKCPLDDGGLRKVRCRGRQDRKSAEKLLACTPTVADISDNMIPESSGRAGGPAAPTTGKPARAWRFTSVATPQDGPQTRHRREAEVATATTQTDLSWSSSTLKMSSTTVDEEIEALEETARRDGVLVEDSDVDLMLADERTIENFVVDSTPTSEATDTEINVIEIANTSSEPATTIPELAASSEPAISSEQSAVTQMNADPITELRTDSLGIKPPMVHARSDAKIVEWTSTEPEDHTAEMKLLGHLPKSQLVLDAKKLSTTSREVTDDNAPMASVDSNTGTTENEASALPVLQKMMPIDSDVVLLKESSYSIIKNDTIIDVLELNETVPEEERLPTDNSVNAQFIDAKPIEYNMVMPDEEKPVKKEDMTKQSEHRVVELTFTEPSVFSSTFVITTKQHVKKSTEARVTTAADDQPAREIDPRIQLLNANSSKINTDSESVFENRSNAVSSTDATPAKESSTVVMDEAIKIKKPESVEIMTPGEVETETTGFQEADMEPSEDVEPEPEPLHRPNRRRLLTKPEPRGGYPFYIRRVLG